MDSSQKNLMRELSPPKTTRNFESESSSIAKKQSPDPLATDESQFDKKTDVFEYYIVEQNFLLSISIFSYSIKVIEVLVKQKNIAPPKQIMLSLSDHRHFKGFAGKFRQIMKDPNEGLEYASALKYKKSIEKQQLEEQQYLRNLIQTCKEAGQMIGHTDFLNIQASLNIVKNIALGNQSQIMENPLINAMLKKKPKKFVNTSKETSQKFTKLSHTFNNFCKPPNFLQQQNFTQNYRVVVKNLKDLQQKRFIKYPSSSLLHTNPDKYKEKVQIGDQLLINSDSQDSDKEKIQSSFGCLAKAQKVKSKRFLRVPLKANDFDRRRRTMSQPSQIRTAYCSLKNKYFKEKTFYNENIIYLKKKKSDMVQLHKHNIDDEAIEPNYQNEETQNSKKFRNLIQPYQSNSKSCKMTRKNYRCGSFEENILRDTSISSKLYMKYWSNSKNHSASYVQTIKGLNLTGIEQGNHTKRLATETTIFKKPLVPKFRSKSQGRKVKTVI